MNETGRQIALVTGGARRIGAAIVRSLHAAGLDIALHYASSAAAAAQLSDELSAGRSGSVHAIQADLRDAGAPERVVTDAVARFGRLDVLVNNAATFYPTPLGTVTEAQWEDMMGANLKVPFFLVQAAAPALAAQRGCVVNITDVHAHRPMRNHSIYSASKAALEMLTRSLARELGPAVRVNAVAPGAILWPEPAPPAEVRQAILQRTSLGRQGTPEEIAQAVLFLVRDATYTTGETLRVDGGRHLYI